MRPHASGINLNCNFADCVTIGAGNVSRGEVPHMGGLLTGESCRIRVHGPGPVAAGLTATHRSLQTGVLQCLDFGFG